MQYLLSGYANWHSKRHQQPGHLFQGRFKAKLVEDESYFWELSRYIHLNPVRGKRPLVKHPRQWPFSSYLGYVQKRHRLDRIAYSTVFDAWQGEVRGRNPTSLSNLTRRVDQNLQKSTALRADIKRIRGSLLKTKNEVTPRNHVL